MYGIAVCEDENKELELFQEMIASYGKQRDWKYQLRSYSSAKAFLETLQERMDFFDAVFLDIYLKDGDGVDIARRLRDGGYKGFIVFLTVSTDHALQAYELDAEQYLLKPLEQKRFFQVLDRMFSKEDADRWMILRIGGELRRICLKEIVFCEAQRNYQCIYMQNGEKYKVRMTMTSLYRELSQCSQFVKVGSAYSFNLACIESINSKYVKFEEGTIRYLPRGSYASLREAYFQYYCEDGDVGRGEKK